MIGDAKTFTVEYSSEILDATFVTNEVNQIQNYVPPIAWEVMAGEDQGIVEYVKNGFLHITTWKIYQHIRIIVFFKLRYIFFKQIIII